MILDSHVHFWDPAARRYDWLDEEPALRRRFGPEDYDAGRHHVAGLIFVQADCCDEEALDEARWVAELATQDPRVSGIVAYAPLHLGARAGSALAALTEQPGLVGIRRLLQDEPESLLRDPVLAEGLQLLAEYGFPFDLCIRCDQLRAASSLVTACPGVTFVLDHLGKPQVGGDEFHQWQGDLVKLAARGNVVCKLSGLATEAGSRWLASDARPHLQHALEVFGPDRCMIGSDWPVSTLATTTDAWFDLVLDTLAELSPGERDAVLHGTASSVYRVIPHTEEP